MGRGNKMPYNQLGETPEMEEYSRECAWFEIKVALAVCSFIVFLLFV